MEEIRGDVEKIGFAASKVSRQHTRSELENGQVIEGTTTRCASYSKPFYALLAALGAPVGEKASIATKVPEWISDGNKLFQREFLSAYFGSEMTRPRMQKGGRNFTSPAFSLNKEEAMLENGIAYVKQLETMMEGFGLLIAYTK